MTPEQRDVVRSNGAATHTLHRLTPYSQIAGSGKVSRQAVPKHHLGAMSHMCTECGAHHWMHEATETKAGQHMFGMCCRKETIQPPALQSTPPVLKALLQGDTPESRGFLAKTRNYNSCSAIMAWCFSVVLLLRQKWSICEHLRHKALIIRRCEFMRPFW